MKHSALLLTVLLVAGCGRPPHLTGPVLDTTAPFPELADAPSHPPAAEGEERIIPLAGALGGALPSEGWRRYADSRVTVLSHLGPDGGPDALVWAEAVSPLAERAPSEELRRFLVTVDPALVRRTGAWPSLPETLAMDPKLARVPAERLREAAAAAMTRTGGRGLGFGSAPDGFAGWRWIGVNGQGVYLRLAFTRGTWGEPARLPVRLKDAVEALVQRDSRLEWLRSGLEEETGGGGPARQEVPAYLVLGNASAPAGSVHLALLCRRAPACAPAVDLAHLLGTLQPLRSLEAAGEEPLPLDELGYELGLSVTPAGALLEP
jgi:hypothetical protein